MPELKRILVVDDDENDRELMLSALKENNLAGEIVVANDGHEGLDYLYCRGRFASRPRGNPSIILVDITMPRLNGIEFARAMRNDPDFKDITIAMLSSSSYDKHIKESEKLNIIGYFIKPLTASKYTELMRELVLIIKNILNVK